MDSSKRTSWLQPEDCAELACAALLSRPVEGPVACLDEACWPIPVASAEGVQRCELTQGIELEEGAKVAGPQTQSCRRRILLSPESGSTEYRTKD